MPPTVTPISARSQTFASIMFGLIVVMGLSPLFEIVALRWPIRFGEMPWRFQTFQLFLANGPQFAVLIAVAGLFGVAMGHRSVVRYASIALGIVVALTFLTLPFFILDFLQAHRLVAQDRKVTFNTSAFKAVAFAGLLVVAGAWGSLRGWQASSTGENSTRRTKGEGLVVGQPKEPRPPV